MSTFIKSCIASLIATFFLLPSMSFAQVTDTFVQDEGAISCITINNNLQYSPRSTDAKTGGDVTDLQEFLKDEINYSGAVSGSFGPLTRAAVKKFQAKTYINVSASNIDQTLVPSASVRQQLASSGFRVSSTGNVGPITRAKIKYVSCAGDDSTISDVTGNAPVIKSISRSSAQTNTVTISGSRFTNTGNTVYLDGYSLSSDHWYQVGTNLTSFIETGLTAYLGQSIVVTLPSTYPCPSYRNGGVGCPVPVAIQAGTHTLTVGNSNGISNAFSFNYNNIICNSEQNLVNGACVNIVRTVTCSNGQIPNDRGTACVTLVATTNSSGQSTAFLFNLSNNSGDQTATTVKVRWYGTSSTASQAPVSCTASGDWSGNWSYPSRLMSGDASTIQNFTVTRGSSPKNLTLTCVNANGVSTSHSLVVDPVTTATVQPTLTLKINGSTGPVSAVANRGGMLSSYIKGTALDGDWTSNVDVTNCGLGAGFTQYQTAPVVNQLTPRSGTIRGSFAQRDWVSTSVQGYDYEMSCQRISASGYTETLRSNTVRVNTCDLGFHVVADNSFNGGTCAPDPSNIPASLPVAIVTSGNIALNQEGHASAGSNGTAAITFTSQGADSCTLLNSPIASNGSLSVTRNLAPSHYNYTCHNGRGDTILSFYVDPVSEVATQTCGTGTHLVGNSCVSCPSSNDVWNGTSCVASTVNVPVTTLLMSKSSGRAAENLTMTLGGSNNPTYYMFSVNTNTPARYEASQIPANGILSGNAQDFGLSLSGTQYTIHLRACNASGCGNEVLGYFTVTAPTSMIQSIQNSSSITSLLNLNSLPKVLGAYTSSITCTSIPRNLIRGSESAYVADLQNFLYQKGLFVDPVSGFYGDKTVEAVKDYQASKDLPVTGMVYDFTREMIRMDSCK